ncbi:MAG: hypothetical protein DDT19_00071 [Syntrophomonadaceae bacterium]|nr:hypothetical protein [Bacillota bacterium]
MRLSEFLEQDKYCREHNTPEGAGCDQCPTPDKEYCADALRNLCARWLKGEGEERKHISEELDKDYGIPPFYQLGLLHGEIELRL